MSALTLFLLAVSLSMDAFAVSVCGGLKMEGRERFKGGVIFGAWFGVFQALMPLIGYELGSHFAKVAEAYSHWIIFLILSYIGWNMIQEAGEDQEKEKVTGFRTMLDWQWLLAWMPWEWAWALPSWISGSCRRYWKSAPLLFAFLSWAVPADR